MVNHIPYPYHIFSHIIRSITHHITSFANMIPTYTTGYVPRMMFGVSERRVLVPQAVGLFGDSDGEHVKNSVPRKRTHRDERLD